MKSEGAFRNARLQRKVATQVCSAIQMNYTSRLQTMFSKWQLLTKMKREDTRGGQNKTENKLLLLKGLMRDRMKLREKQAFERWR